MAEKKRESPTYIKMGSDGQLLHRMGQPLKKQAEELYAEIYDGVPGPGLGPFLGYLIGEGIVAVRTARIGKQPAAASPGRRRRPAQ